MLYNGCVHNVSASSENLRDNDGKDLMQKPQMFKVQKSAIYMQSVVTLRLSIRSFQGAVKFENICKSVGTSHLPEKMEKKYFMHSIIAYIKAAAAMLVDFVRNQERHLQV